MKTMEGIIRIFVIVALSGYLFKGLIEDIIIEGDLISFLLKILVATTVYWGIEVLVI